MTPGLFTLRELRQAAAWIAEDNPGAAENLLTTAIAAARLVTQRPTLARFRFWSLRGYPYLLVVDADSDPPVIARFVHQARDLPAALEDL